MIDSYTDDYVVPDNWKAFFFQRNFANQRYGFVYLLVDQALETQLLGSIDKGIIPDYAVVLEAGAGIPSPRTRYRMERYYGFKPDIVKNVASA